MGDAGQQHPARRPGRAERDRCGAAVEQEPGTAVVLALPALRAVIVRHELLGFHVEERCSEQLQRNPGRNEFVPVLGAGKPGGPTLCRLSRVRWVLITGQLVLEPAHLEDKVVDHTFSPPLIDSRNKGSNGLVLPRSQAMPMSQLADS